MFTAKKNNKEYSIQETEKNSYLRDGYDIFDGTGKLIEKSPLTIVTYAEHKQVLDENAKLKERNKELEAALADALSEIPGESKETKPADAKKNKGDA